MSQFLLETIVARIKKYKSLVVAVVIMLAMVASYFYIESAYDIWREDLGYGFSRKDGYIYYNDGSSYVTLYGVDSRTFQPIDSMYSRDKDKFYRFNIYLYQISNIDIQTLEILSGGFLKDKRGLYFDGEEKKSCGLTYLSGINSNNFSILNTGIIKDDKYVYRVHKQQHKYDCVQNMIYMTFSNGEIDRYRNSEKYAVQSNEFKALQGDYYQYTGLVVYVTREYYEVLSGSNPQNFTIIDDNYAMSSGNMYFRGREIKKTDPGSLRFFELMICEDNDNVYYIVTGTFLSDRLYTYVSVVEDADIKSFVVISGVVAKDQYKSYMNGIKLVWHNGNKTGYIDADSFQILSELGGVVYAKDISRVYYSDAPNDFEVVYGVDVATFRAINTRYAKDKNNVYYRGKKIYGDLETFDGLKGEFVWDEYAKDKNHVYFDGNILRGADSNSATSVEYDEDGRCEGCIKDKRHRWARGKIVN